MKNLLTTFTLLFSLFLLFSCNEDKCEDINCYNQGVCIDGQCDCTERYTGESCLDEKTPSSITINQFFIRPYDLNPNGEVWDAEVGEEAPDIYLSFLDGNNEEILNSSDFEIINAPNSFTINYDWIISNVTEIHTVQVFDKDYGMGADELILSFTFIPFETGEGFPDSIEKIFSADGIPPTVDGQISMDVVYSFN